MSEIETTSMFSPEPDKNQNNFALALAISQRISKEQTNFDYLNLATEITDYYPEVFKPQLTPQTIELQALIFEHYISNGRDVLGSIDYAFENLDEQGFFEIAVAQLPIDNIADFYATYKPKDIKILAKQVNSIIIDLLGSSLKLDFYADIASYAKELGHQKGIKPEKIIIEDNLYSDVIRRSYLPEQYAQLMITLLNNLGLTRFTNLYKELANAYIAFQHGDAKNYFLIDEFDEEEQNELKKLHKLIILESCLRTIDAIHTIWGKDAFDNLPENLKEQLAL